MSFSLPLVYDLRTSAPRQRSKETKINTKSRESLRVRDEILRRAIAYRKRKECERCLHSGLVMEMEARIAAKRGRLNLVALLVIEN